MNSKKYKFIFYLFIFTLVLGFSHISNKNELSSFRKPFIPDNTSQPTETLPSSNSNSESKQSSDIKEEKITKNFRGTIDHDKAITLHLQFNPRGQVISGDYYYETFHDYIFLKLIRQQSKQLILEESDNEGNKTGEFSGFLEKTILKGRASWKYQGTWISSNQDRKYPFELTQMEYRFANGSEFISKKFAAKEKNVEMEYPQIEPAKTPSHLAFNKFISQLIKQDYQSVMKDFSEDKENKKAETLNQEKDEETNYFNSKTYQIIYFSEDLISISFEDSSYTGGAHPMNGSSSVNYDLKMMKNLNLKDLFLKDNKYIKTISDYSIKKLMDKLEKEDNTDIKRGAGPSLKNYENWNITDGGLLFTFDPYVVASYADGPQEVFIPYSQLCPLIDLNKSASSFCKK